MFSLISVLRADAVYIADVYECMSCAIHIGNCCLHVNIAVVIDYPKEFKFPNYLLRCNAFLFFNRILGLAEDFGGCQGASC